MSIFPGVRRNAPIATSNSHLSPDEIDETHYVESCLKDLDHDLSQHKAALSGRALSSIFIGGGTPSLFEADSIAQLIDGISDRINTIDDVEITLEANPGSSEATKFSGFSPSWGKSFVDWCTEF